jgi:hypothetical protein
MSLSQQSMYINILYLFYAMLFNVSLEMIVMMFQYHTNSCFNFINIYHLQPN